MLAIETREAIRSWMFDAALPFWAGHALDLDNGGYVEQLTLDGKDAAVAFKRTRVAARQVYVFSHAAVMGWSAGSELAAPGMEWLTTRAWMAPDQGFARTLSRDGDVLDPTLDLYDHAFVLFAFAWRHRAMKDDFSRQWLHRTMDVIEGRMKHPGGLGFWHEVPASGWRQQNPHMHLTEACLAAFEATGEERFAEAARRIIHLFGWRMFDGRTLAEFFNDDWSRAPEPDGRRVEPGHMFEWTWILNEARKLLDMDTAATMRALAAFAESNGVDPASSMTFNAIDDSGKLIDRGSRTWPNCERIKAAVALYELDGVAPGPVIDGSASLLLEQYFACEPPGIWMDAYDGEGRPAAKTVPASTLYHVFLAFSEVLRISD